MEHLKNLKLKNKFFFFLYNYYGVILEISLNEFEKLNNREIIDLRDNYFFNIFHLPSSVNIPYTLLLIYMDQYLSKEKNYLLVCEQGFKSKKTSEILNRNGYHTYSLKKGIEGLKYEF